MEVLVTTGKGSVDVTGLLLSARWSGDYRQAARTFSFSLLSSPTDRSIPVVDCPLGAGVRMTHAGRVLFDGFLFTRTKKTDASTIECTCFDRGIYLTRNKCSVKIVEQTAEAAAAQICGEFGIPVGALEATGVTLSRNFLGVRLFDALTTLYTLASRETGKLYHLGFVAEKLVIREKKPDDRTLVIEGGSNLIAASTTESAEQVVSAVAVYDEQDKQVQIREDAERLRLYGRMQEYVKQSQKDDRTAAVQKLLREGDVTQKITVDCLGNAANAAGGAVVVREPYTGLYGLFWIDADVHEWKRGQYFNKLTLNFEKMMSEAEAGSMPNADGKKTGGNGAPDAARSSAQYTYINKPGGKS